MEKRRPNKQQPQNVPDLTDFMNDMFFGASDTNKKTYNLTGDRDGFITAGDDFLEQSARRSVSSRMMRVAPEDDSLETARRSLSSRSTEEWLNEARRMVAKSPARGESPNRITSSPRFSISQQKQNVVPSLDRRDPLSRSARRHRSPQGFSGEILTKTANKHTRNNSEIELDNAKEIQPQQQPASNTVHKWFSNILKPQNVVPQNDPPSDPVSPKSLDNPRVPPLPPRQSVSRRSRFQSSNNAPHQNLIPTRQQDPSPSKRTFKISAPINVTASNIPTSFDNQLLSPPKHLVESAHRRSISSSTCSVGDNSGINTADSTHRRQVSASNFSDKNIVPNKVVPEQQHSDKQDLNEYLKEQKAKIQHIMSGSTNGKAKIVLSGHSNSTSSMVAAISYAWLLENRVRGEKKEVVVVPVMNIKRGEMWKQKQAAWLFHHLGLDTKALLFSDEVDLEMLVMEKKLSIHVVGDDILKTNGEVGSGCTIVTDNYCENAYDLLQTTTLLKKLLLAGILIDTQNLTTSTKLSITRDSAAIQLLLVGSVHNYRDTLFDQLKQDQKEAGFIEDMENNYGKCPLDKDSDNAVNVKIEKSSHNVKNVKANKISPSSGKGAAAGAAKGGEPQKGKNGFFLAKWFGFGSK